MDKEFEQAKLSDQFSKVEKMYNDFLKDENCDEAHYTEAIKLLNIVTGVIKERGLFSPNEDFSEIQTGHLKYLLVPYYLGDIYGRSMDDRKDKVKKSNVISSLLFIINIELFNTIGILHRISQADATL